MPSGPMSKTFRRHSKPFDRTDEERISAVFPATRNQLLIRTKCDSVVLVTIVSGAAELFPSGVPAKRKSARILVRFPNWLH